MADATGIEEIDRLLDEWRVGEFAGCGDALPGHTVPVELLRDGAFAADRCVLASESLVAFLRSRGLDQAGREAYLSGDEWDGDEMIIERISPDDFGYQDRAIPGCNSHTVCQIDWDGRRFMVDFTAAQYGYREFPMVQRLVGDQCDWDRDFLAGEQTPATVGALT